MTARNDSSHVSSCAAVLANAMGRDHSAVSPMKQGVLLVQCDEHGNLKVFAAARPGVAEGEDDALFTQLDLDADEEAVLSMVITRWGASCFGGHIDWVDLSVCVQLPSSTYGAAFSDEYEHLNPSQQMAVGHLLTTCDDLLKPGVPARLREQHAVPLLAQATTAWAMMMVAAAKVVAENG